MVVISKTETVPYDNQSQELAPSSPSMPLPQFPLQETPNPPPSNQNSNSIMSLTLDEIQCKSGRMFGSMSMDEFLANIWNSDENQVDSPLPVPPPPPPLENNKNLIASSSTTDQLSNSEASFSVPPPICKKTVDEVWSEIHKDQKKPQQIETNESLKRQPTLGEMTLEDFLIKAGVVQESSLSSLPLKSSSSPPPPPTPTPTPPLQDNNRSYHEASYKIMGPAMRMGNGGAAVSAGNGVAAATYQVFSVPQSHGLGVNDATTSSGAVAESSGNNGSSSSKKRIIDGPPEVVVERRQRRMLKNRESAARSRARRQAYTVELEAGLGQLRQENERLKQILAEAERKRKQEIAQRKHSTKAQKRTEKFRALRRTVSMSW